MTGRARRPIEHLLGDVYLAEARFAWAESRLRRSSASQVVADFVLHAAVAADARARLRDAEWRMKDRSEGATEPERDRAHLHARFRIQRERATNACDCWRCTDRRAIAAGTKELTVRTITFKVLLGVDHLEVRVQTDGSYLGATNLDNRTELSAEQLRVHVLRIGRARVLEGMVQLHVEADGRATELLPSRMAG